MMNHTSMSQYTIVWLIHGDEKYGVASAMRTLVDTVNTVNIQPQIATLFMGDFAEDLDQRHSRAVIDLNMGPAPGLSGPVTQKFAQWLKLRRYARHAAKRLIEQTHAFQPDAFHVIWPNLVGVAGLAASQVNAPCFWEMPNYISDRYPLGLNRRMYQRQCAKLGVTPLANSAYTASTLGSSPVKPIVMHLSADAHRFDPQTVQAVTREELGIPEDAAVIGIMARLSTAKGQYRLTEALAELHRTQTASASDVHLLFLGGPVDGEQAERIRQLAQQTGEDFARRIHMLGEVRDPQRYYPVMNISANLRPDPEPFGISVVESMLMGVPVMAHALGGPAETVIDGQTGWHLSDMAPATIVQGLRRVLADRPNWPQLASAAREHALEHFTAEAQARRYRAAVDHVMQQREAGS